MGVSNRNAETKHKDIKNINFEPLDLNPTTLKSFYGDQY